MNSNNVQSLLDAANQYQIEPVKKMCVDFLKEQADASNCFSLSVLAECLDCPELKATADDFIHQHFVELFKTDECLQLDAKRVTHLLTQDTLTVRAEDLASLMAQTVKNPPAMLEAWVGSLGWEDPLEKGIATHSSILAWRFPRIEEPGVLQSHGVAKSRTQLSD